MKIGDEVRTRGDKAATYERTGWYLKSQLQVVKK